MKIIKVSQIEDKDVSAQYNSQLHFSDRVYKFTSNLHIIHKSDLAEILNKKEKHPLSRGCAIEKNKN